MKNYIIIDKIELEELVRQLSVESTITASPIRGYECDGAIKEINKLIFIGKDLQPVLEDAFNEGFEDGIIASFGDNTDGGLMFRIKESEKQEYINNFKL